jgi:hypothetical protein
MTTRRDWGHVLDRAREIAESYDTALTLRQLFYRLVSVQLIPNDVYHYKRLSEVTAEARRNGTFPALTDRTRAITEYQTFSSPADAIRYAAQCYRIDRTEGQDVALYLAVEKDGMVAQLDDWFDRFGLPILALKGYASQSYADRVARHVYRQGRPAVLIYAGDHDPSGWDIPRDFEARTRCWKAVHRIALTPEQVAEYNLPENPGKDTDSRAEGFEARFGDLVQVELDALDPDDLRDLYAAAIAEYWDESAHDAALAREKAETEELQRIAGRMRGAKKRTGPLATGPAPTRQARSIPRSLAATIRRWS